HEQGVGPVRLALAALLLLGGRRFLVSVHGDALGGSGGPLPLHVRGILSQLPLGLQLGDVYRGAGRFQLTVQVLAPLQEVRLTRLEVVQARLNRLCRLVAGLQQVEHLFVGALELGGDLTGEQVLDPHLRELAEQLLALDVQLEELCVGPGKVCVELARALLLLAYRVRDGAQCVGSREARHRQSHSVMAPPVVGNSYSGSRKPARFTPKVSFWMMPSSDLSSRTCSNVSSSTRSPQVSTLWTTPVSSDSIGTLTRRPSSPMASTIT